MKSFASREAVWFKLRQSLVGCLLLMGATAVAYAAPTDAIAPAAQIGPREVVLALDVSGSMRADGKLPLLIGGVTAMLAILPDGTLVSVVAFNHESRVLVKRAVLDNTVRAAMIAQLDAIQASGGTDIIGAGESSLNITGPRAVVVLLSDGQQTGSANQPVPRGEWESRAGRLTAEARLRHVQIMTIGLSPQADRALLEVLAKQTGGTYFAVPASRDLVARYIDIASIAGRLWRRNTPGRFTVTAAETAVVVSHGAADPAGPIAAVLPQGRRAAIPLYQTERGDVTTRRYQLPSGEYEFRSEGASDLLRVMPFEWEVATRIAVPANRQATVPIGVHTPSADISDAGLSVVFRAGSTDIAAFREPDGQFKLSVAAPSRIGEELRGDLIALQHGFFYDIGPLTLEAIPPDPIDVMVTLSADSHPLRFCAAGKDREFQLQVTARSEILVPGLRLQLAAGDRFQITPDNVTLAGGDLPVTVVVTCRELELPLVRTELLITAHSEDVVPALVNGAASWVRPLDWHNLKPGITLFNLPEPDAVVKIERGGSAVIPLRIEGRDLAAAGKSDAGVLLDASSFPPQLNMQMFRQACGTENLVTVLKPVSGSVAFLKITADQNAAPGAYPVRLQGASTHSAVLLNGSAEPLVSRFEIAVVTDAVEISSTPNVLEELAPVDDERQEVVVLVSAKSGRPLPLLKIAATVQPEHLFRVIERSRSLTSEGQVRAVFEVVIPSQTAPGVGRIEFRINDRDYAESRPGEVPVRAPEHVVTVNRPLIVVQHYPRWFEWLLGFVPWRRAQAVTLRLAATPTDGPHIDWTVVPRGEVADAALPWLSLEAAAEVPVDGAHDVLLRSAYRHTTFCPGSRLPITVQPAWNAAPAWFWFLAVGLFALPVVRKALQRVVPGRFELISGGPEGGLVIHLGRRHPAFTLGGRRFNMKMLGSQPYILWHTFDKADDAPAPEIQRADGLVTPMLPGEWTPISNTDELAATPDDVARFVSTAVHSAPTDSEFDSYDILSPSIH